MTSPMHGSDLFARIRVKPAWQSLPARTRRNPILCPRKKEFINEKKWEEMRRHGDSEKNNCSQCLLFINDSLLWFIHVESSVEFLKGTMLYSCAIFFDSFSAMCFMFFFDIHCSPHIGMPHIVSVWSGWCWFRGHQTTRGRLWSLRLFKMLNKVVSQRRWFVRTICFVC